MPDEEVPQRWAVTFGTPAGEVVASIGEEGLALLKQRLENPHFRMHCLTVDRYGGGTITLIWDRVSWIYWGD